MSTPEENIKIKCGNYCLPEKLTEQILEDMKTYAKEQSEKYAKHYFITRTSVGHPLGINEYDLWNESNNNIDQDQERCVSCDDLTPYTKNTHITERYFYVEGGGQLCKECHTKIYNN
jgi:hypothetical protein|tara:strand:+ start:1402 stop:1752 length:351 start_codon:yes stop_codon:yes gene_type:complete